MEPMESPGSKRKRQVGKKNGLPEEFTSSWSLNPPAKKQKAANTPGPSFGAGTSARVHPKAPLYPSIKPAPSPVVGQNQASQVNVASDVRMVPKALKACRSCRKSKIKCESKDGMKCKRCLEQNIECVFEVKVPTTQGTPDTQWMSTVESRLDRFGSTLDVILGLLTNQGRASSPLQNAYGYSPPQAALSDSPSSQDLPAITQPPMNHHHQHITEDNPTYLGQQQQQQQHQKQLHSPPMGVYAHSGRSSPSQDFLRFLSPSEEQTIAEMSTMPHEVARRQQYHERDSMEQEQQQAYLGIDPISKLLAEFQHGQASEQEIQLREASSSDSIKSITFDQARQLFQFFHEKISPHLFGFPISHKALHKVWNTSPILVAAICTVAAIHHSELNVYFDDLRKELEALSKDVMFKPMGSESEAIDTIIALCVAGFWLPNSYMLTAVALRIAQNIGLPAPQANFKDRWSMENLDMLEDGEKDRLRLWYLLYILDGHQSLTYNQVPSIGYDDPAVLKSRNYLLAGKKGNELAIEQQKQEQRQENGGLNTSDLISDMRLVSQVEFNQAVKCIFDGRGWDILRPSSIGIPWQTNIELDKWMVSWACLLTPTAGAMGSWPSKSTLIHYNFAKMHINSRAIRDLQANNRHGNLKDVVISSRGGLTHGDVSASDNIAVSAAQNVLKLSTTDKDILSALQYVPIHIHMMLYYAALLLLHSLSEGNKKSDPGSKRAALALVRRLRTAMINCGTKRNHLIGQITDGLERAISDKTLELQEHYQISELIDGPEEYGEGRTPIAAWPGSVASHSRP
ncbi:hypothetical protein TRVA0_003S01618 [Trichomonascus vanleenenianus]|uniref:uncharacterized protein n=1 Tax=Trichomonascus vanleenenianus TaxID=2268995 RepID=UPI003EC9B5D6